MFGFCACTNIKRVPGYKETDPDVQFADSYPDNQVSVPAILDMKFRMLYAILTRELLYEYSTRYMEKMYPYDCIMMAGFLVSQSNELFVSPQQILVPVSTSLFLRAGLYLEHTFLTCHTHQLAN